MDALAFLLDLNAGPSYTSEGWIRPSRETPLNFCLRKFYWTREVLMRQSCIDGAGEQRSEPVLELVHWYIMLPQFRRRGEKRPSTMPIPWLVTS